MDDTNATTHAVDGAQPAPQHPPGTVTLETPVQLGSQLVTHVTVRRPNAGELRGLALAPLLQLDVASLQMLLPRITTPMLPRAVVDSLDPVDLLQLGSEVSSFLLTKADRLPSPTA